MPIPVSSVEEWINKEGYPLEFKARAAFESAGFIVSQGHYVASSDPGKMREIDLFAVHCKKIENISYFIAFLVECKSPPKAAAILAKAPGDAAPLDPLQCNLLAEAQAFLSHRRHGTHWPTLPAEFRGFGVVTAPEPPANRGNRQPNERDIAYDGMAHALDAALQLCLQENEVYKKSESVISPDVSLVAVPVVVWADTIASIWWSAENGRLTANTAQSAAIDWSGNIKSTNSTIYFLKADEATEWAKAAMRFAEEMIATLSAEQHYIDKAFKTADNTSIEVDINGQRLPELLWRALIEGTGVQSAQ